ncbi:MAG: hypothetical protein NVSMB4_01540 [Acidimicrobiales bacterium]
MRGKHAAKAANRLAALDNEVIAELTAERDALKAELAETAARLRAAESETRTEAMRLGAVLARDEVADLKERLVEEVAERTAERERLGFEVWSLFNSDLYNIESRDKFAAMAEVFGLGDRLGDLFTAAGSGDSLRNRRARRATAKGQRRSDALWEEARAHGYARSK